MFISAKYVLQFSGRNDLQNIGIDLAIENRRIVSPFIFEAAGRTTEGNISCNYQFHIATRFKSQLKITDVIFFAMLAVKFVG